MISTDILIIGAGLTGLTLQYLLEQNGIAAKVVEARNRIGGRILTNFREDFPPIEMGATWLGKKHQNLIALLKQLKLKIYLQKIDKQAIYELSPQHQPELVNLPPNDEPSYRIKGGSSVLIQALNQNIKTENIYLNRAIHSIQIQDNKVIAISNTEEFHAKLIVSTLPPKLLISQIKMEPALPQPIQKLMQNTHTWMGESIKVGLVYKRPFWREQGTSGTFFSNVGPITEFYDHSNFEDNLYAMKGFVHDRFAVLSPSERKKAVLDQLQRYYGNIALDYVDYQEKVWSEDSHTYTTYEQFVLPHYNNGHAAFRQPFWEGKLWIAGSETAAEFPGYMDGAVSSAFYTFRELKRHLVL